MNVVVQDEEELFSLLVDEVGDVIEVSRDIFEEPPATLDERWRESCDGVYRLKEELLVAVNVPALLNVQRGRTEVASGQTIGDTTRLREAFAHAMQQGDLLAAVCYATLFDRYPEMKPLFAEMDLERQKRMLMVVLDVVVQTLGRSEITGRYLQSLGEQHAEHGVKPAHYLALGQCLLHALEELTGAEWNQESQERVDRRLPRNGQSHAHRHTTGRGLTASEDQPMALEVQLLRESFRKVAPKADQLGHHLLRYALPPVSAGQAPLRRCKPQGSEEKADRRLGPGRQEPGAARRAGDGPRRPG